MNAEQLKQKESELIRKWSESAISLNESEELINHLLGYGILNDALKDHISELKKALLALSRAYSDWHMNVSDEDEQLISRLLKEAAS